MCWYFYESTSEMGTNGSGRRQREAAHPLLIWQDLKSLYNGAKSQTKNRWLLQGTAA